MLAVGNGGFNVDIDSDNSDPKVMSLSDAKQMCTADGHAGFTYQPSQQRVWWLKAITDTSGFYDGAGQFDVYLTPTTAEQQKEVEPAVLDSDRRFTKNTMVLVRGLTNQRDRYGMLDIFSRPQFMLDISRAGVIREYNPQVQPTERSYKNTCRTVATTQRNASEAEITSRVMILRVRHRHPPTCTAVECWYYGHTVVHRRMCYAHKDIR